MIWQDYILRMSVWDWLLSLLVTVDFVWLALPSLVFLVYGSVSTHHAESGMDDADLPVDPRIYNQLLDLGLQPLGAIRTRHWLTCNGWNKRVKQCVFGGGERRCLVLVWTTYEGESPYIRFLSFFQDGHCISTSNEYVGQFRVGNHAARALLSCDVSRLAEFHFDKVGVWTAIGHPLHHHDTIPLLLNNFQTAQQLPFPIRNELVSLRLTMFIAVLAVPALTIFSFGFDTALLTLGLFVTQLLPLYVCLRLYLFPISPRDGALRASLKREEAAARSAVQNAPLDH